MILRILYTIIFTIVFVSIGTAGDIKGQLVDPDGLPIPYATVSIGGTTIGSITMEDGSFIFEDVSEGTYTLICSMLGYQKRQISVQVPDKGSLNVGTIHLNEDMLGLNEVVITGTMRETFVKASPIKVEVVTAERLTKNLPAMNLMAGLKLINGVQEVVACGVCFTNSISINGLPGPYTSVLMDGSPVYGNLASIYGLNGIPIQMIDRIEVVKGPNSTLYGSEAIAGVLNVITKNPEDQPLLSTDILATTHGEFYTNIAIAQRMGRWNQYSGVNHTYVNRYEDSNGDGFGDAVGLDRLSVLTKWSLKRPEHRKFTVSLKFYGEDRRNGVQDYVEHRAYRSLRGNDSIYGESIYTKRAEVFGTYDLAAKEDVRLDYSMSWHDQDSYYGNASYTAKQGIAYTNLIWVKKRGIHTVCSGFTNRYQYYDDNTIATNEQLNDRSNGQYIPGVFAEDEMNFKSRWTLLGGMRLDHYSEHGIIPSPRLSSKFQWNEWTTVRMNFGTGFKIVNLFTEDHAFVTGQRVVEIEESLHPERSWSASTNLNHTHSLFNTSGSLDLDVYYTHFSNKIIPDYSTPGKIVYSNSNGFAQTYGVSITFNQQFTEPLAYNLGVNINRATFTEIEINGKTHTDLIEFAPGWSGVFTLNYSIKSWKTDLALTTNVTGPMRLPLVYDLDENGQPVATPRAIKSSPFTSQNIQVTKRFGTSRKFECYGGVQNLFNYRQPDSPITGFNDPATPPGFSPYFDTSYAYAPIHGRELYLGLRMNLDHSSKN